MQQAYMTTNYPVDQGGNYYYPIMIPDGAQVQLPITNVVPDPGLGDKGLKFDWQQQKWITSDQDPTLRLIEQMQGQLQANQMMTLGIMKDQLDEGSNK